MELNISLLNYTNQTSETNLDENRFVTLVWTFVIPSICCIGAITNLLSTISLIKIKSKEIIHKYMLANSVIKMLYTFMCAFICLVRCGRMCPVASTSFVIVLYKYLIYDYVTSCMAVFNILIEIVLSLQRCSIVSNWKRFRFERFNVVILMLTGVSFLPYIPCLFLSEMTSGEGINQYKIVDSKIGSS